MSAPATPHSIIVQFVGSYRWWPANEREILVDPAVGQRGKVSETVNYSKLLKTVRESWSVSSQKNQLLTGMDFRNLLYRIQIVCTVTVR